MDKGIVTKRVTRTLGGVSVLCTALASVSAAGQQQAGERHELVVGDLGNDIRPGVGTEGGHGAVWAGPVLDGGAVFVDLGGDEPITLSIDAVAIDTDGLAGTRPPRAHPRVRVVGGAPGSAGAILLDDRAPVVGAGHLSAGALAIAGRFDADGTLVIDLPEATIDVFVQAVEVTPLGALYSGIRRIAPGAGSELSDDAPTWDARRIADAVRGATSSAGDAPVRLRFFGAARQAGVQGTVDVDVVLGRDPDHGGGFVLSAPAPQRRFASRTELSDALELLLRRDALAGVAAELRSARARLAVAGASSGAVVHRPTGALPAGGTLGDAGTVTVQLPALEPSWEVLNELPAPRRAGDKHRLPPVRDGRIATHDGALGDAGDATVALPGEAAAEVAFDDVTPLAEPPRAGTKRPVHHLGEKGTGILPGGAVGDAGTRTVLD